MANEFEALSALDRTGLMKRTAEEFPDIRKKLSVKVEDLADKVVEERLPIADNLDHRKMKELLLT